MNEQGMTLDEAAAGLESSLDDLVGDAPATPEAPKASEEPEEDNSDDAEEPEAEEVEGDEEAEGDEEEPEADEEEPEAEEADGEAPSTLEDAAKKLGMDLQQLLASIKHRVKVAGEEQEVTLQELASGYTRRADYTRKTEELARQRDDFIARSKKREDDFEAAQAGFVGALQQVRSLWAQQLDKIRQDPYAREEDPASWVAKQKELENQIGYFDQVVGYSAQQYQTRMKQLQQEITRYEVDSLKKAMPEWGAEHSQKAEAELRRLGLGDADLEQLYDHRMYLGALELANARAKIAELEAVIERGRTKARTPPKRPTQVPRGRPPERGSRDEARQNARRRFAKSGSLDDAANLLMLHEEGF